jgi:hypothetical protein
MVSKFAFKWVLLYRYSMGSSRSLADLVRQGSVANLGNVHGGMSRQGSVADITRMGRNQSVSNISDHSSEMQFQHTRPEALIRGEEVQPPSPVGSPSLPYSA